MQVSSQSLAAAVWPQNANRAVQTIALIVGGTVILAISAKISVPFWPVPMTLQTLAIMAISAAYGSRLAVATVVAYLAEGLAGLPVFALGAAAGPAYFLGPTAGYLAGFVLLAWIVGSAADRGWDRSIPRLLASMVVADVVVFALGFAWLAWLFPTSSGSGIGAAAAFSNGVAPFVVADLLKIALAALAVPAAWKLVDRWR